MLRSYYPYSQKIRQSGQAMVEYAILLTVMVTLIAGGVELGLAAFNSNRTAEAAKAGSSEWLKKGLIYAIDNGTGRFIDNPNDVAGLGTINALDTYGIGDHTSSDDALLAEGYLNGPGFGNFSNPVCDPVGGHTTGLPADAEPAGDKVYLYNPLPLDISGCPSASGSDFTTFLSGLPQLNQALLSLYVKQCIDAAANIIDCTKADPTATDKVYLRLPGGTHIDPVNPDPVNPDPTAMTKLAIFTEDSTSLERTAGQDTGKDIGARETDIGTGEPIITPTGFLDTFRMHCKLAAPEPANVVGGVNYEFDDFPSRLEEDNCKALCYDSDLTLDADGDGNPTNDGHTDLGPARACDVRITVRYRHIFESLVLMMQWKNPVVSTDRRYTDSPFDTGGELLRGVLGTEITRGFVLKAQKTFLGCYDTVSVINKTSTGGGNSLEAISCN